MAAMGWSYGFKRLRFRFQFQEKGKKQLPAMAYEPGIKRKSLPASGSCPCLGPCGEACQPVLSLLRMGTTGDTGWPFLGSRWGRDMSFIFWARLKFAQWPFWLLENNFPGMLCFTGLGTPIP